MSNFHIVFTVQENRQDFYDVQYLSNYAPLQMNPMIGHAIPPITSRDKMIQSTDWKLWFRNVVIPCIVLGGIGHMSLKDQLQKNAPMHKNTLGAFAHCRKKWCFMETCLKKHTSQL